MRAKRTLYLASASPRRKELLGAVFPRIKIHVPRAAEKKAPSKVRGRREARALVATIAEAKAAAALQELVQQRRDNFALIAADTLVFHGQRVLGKPKNTAAARKTLSSLSNRKHLVFTAVSIYWRANGAVRRKTIVEESRVEFRRLSPALIDWYISTGEPMDKAGAYGAQDRGALLLRNIQGSYTNVVGLPLAETLELLAALTERPWQDWV